MEAQQVRAGEVLPYYAFHRVCRPLFISANDKYRAFARPLKAFLRDRKSRDNNRRSRRRSNLPVESDPHLSSGDDAHLEVDTHDTSIAAQESSSQSSADPQTPSPLYSEPIVHHATSANDETSIHQTLNLDSVDPHFARLLTSLSLSASASSIEESSVGKIVGHQPPSSSVVQPSSTDSAPPSSRSPSQSGTIRPVRTPSTVPAVSPPRTPAHQRKPSRAVVSPSPLKQSSAPDAPSRAAMDGVDNLSRPSPQTRRPNADISPYLQRATATPAIPKQMKYISMLESVAKESERMTPKIERQMMAMGGPSIPAPGPPPSSLNSMYGAREESPVIYSSGPGPSGSMLGFNNPPTLPSFHPAPTSSANDPFTVRPPTNNTFHAPYPIPSARPSFSEEQLMYTMPSNGPRPPLGPPPVAQQSPYPGPRMAAPLVGPHPGPYAVQQPYPPPRGPANQPNLRLVPPQQLLPSTEYNEPAPLSAPAISPTFNLPRANPANAHLLSILNAPAMPRQPNGDPAFVTIGPR